MNWYYSKFKEHILRKEKSCGCITFNHELKVLLVHIRHGHWSFPKGHVEEGESELDTAIRETYEETHVKIDVDTGFREVSTYSPFPGVMKDVVFFIGKALNEDIIIQEDELQNAGFYSVSDAKSMITYDQDLQIFNHAVAYIDIQIEFSNQ